MKMEYKPSIDCNLAEIPREENARIRTVVRVEDIDESSGTFVVSNHSGIKVTCLPSPGFRINFGKGDFITLFGIVLPADEKEIEIRVEKADKISEKEYMSFSKYLNLRNELLNHGSGDNRGSSV